MDFMEMDFSNISIDELNYFTSSTIEELHKRLTNLKDVITYKEPNSLITQFQWNHWKKFLSNKF